MANVLKAVVVSESMVKTFNKDNRFESLCTIDQITPEIINTKGFDPNIMKTPLTTKNYGFTPYGSLADGTPLTISEELNKSMQITAFNIVNVDGVDKLQVTVPSFIPQDLLLSGDKLYYMNSEATALPIINNVKFSTTVTHNTAVEVDVEVIYNYDAKVKVRAKCNDGSFTDYTPAVNPTSTIPMSIPFSLLKPGENTITFEVTTEDNTKTATKVVENAINVINENPALKIITADSTPFQVHFQISDLDESDKVAYKISISNTKYTDELLQDWTDFENQPLNKLFYIDTRFVVPNVDNIIKIEYKDNYGGTGSGVYSFKGSYKNLLFEDEEGNYYSTDTGAVLKLLHIENLIAGQISTIKHVKLRNSTGQTVSNVAIDVNYQTAVEGTKLKLSKTINPFIPMDTLDFGTEEIPADGYKDLYMRLETSINSAGICRCIINARSQVLPTK